MTEDEKILSEAVRRLTTDNDKLKATIHDLQGQNAHLTMKVRLFDLGRLLVWGLPIIAASALIWVLGIYPLYKVIITPRVVNHCIVEQHCWSDDDHRVCDGRVRLTGVVEWGTDITHGVFDTVAQAVTAAELLGCPVRVQ